MVSLSRFYLVLAFLVAASASIVLLKGELLLIPLYFLLRHFHILDVRLG